MTQRSTSGAKPAPGSRQLAADPHRDYALRVAGKGFSLLAHAVNACDNPATPYRFAEAEREQFMSLCAKLYALIEGGRIEARSLAIAQDDLAFQRFVHRSVSTRAVDDR
jgi:hypothetical protein